MLIVQAALAVLPHRQYKTARTETRRHLLLKIRQMPTQTSASRGYVFVRHKGGIYAICCLVPIRDTHKSPTNCLPGCGHDPRSAPNLERHGSSKMQTFGWLEIHIFWTEFPSAFLHEILECVSNNITYQSKICLERQSLPAVFWFLGKAVLRRKMIH